MNINENQEKQKRTNYYKTLQRDNSTLVDGRFVSAAGTGNALCRCYVTLHVGVLFSEIRKRGNSRWCPLLSGCTVYIQPKRYRIFVGYSDRSTPIPAVRLPRRQPVRMSESHINRPRTLYAGCRLEVNPSRLKSQILLRGGARARAPADMADTGVRARPPVFVCATLRD